MATAMETQGTHISDLPVDVLLEVFRRLPAADLTQGVSEVCVDWRDLAVEPGAWQGRRVQVAPRKHRPLTPSERRVLHRAPALRALSVSLRRAQDLPERLSALLPRCVHLRELQLSLPSLRADTAADVAAHWPRLRELRVEACGLQDGALDRLGQLRQLRGLQLATLQPGHTAWGALRRALRDGLPALRSLHVDARCDVASPDDLGEAVGTVRQAADRLRHLRLGALVPANTDLLVAVGQCRGLRSLHIEDCSALTDEGLLSLAGLRLESLTLSLARSLSTAALVLFLQMVGLSELHYLDLSGCPALNDRVLRLIDSRCSSPPKLIAQDCPNVSTQALQSLHHSSNANTTSEDMASTACTIEAVTAAPSVAVARSLGVV